MCKGYVDKDMCVNMLLVIGGMAREALLEEVYTTPKPGLVDLYSNGAHKDMNIDTFEKSAEILQPFFVRMVYQGFMLCKDSETLFKAIRKTGMDAEKAMYRATNGVNTHKGAIFTQGIFCAAAGRCIREYGRVTYELLIAEEQKMVVRFLSKELLELKNKSPESNGEKNLQKYGSKGARGEALAGYPSVMKVAIPSLRKGKREKREWNLVKLQTLMELMSCTEDSNVLARHDPAILEQVQQEACDFLKRGGAYRAGAVEELMRLDEEYRRRNISPGGCADLLAAALLIEALCGQEAEWRKQ